MSSQGNNAWGSILGLLKEFGSAFAADIAAYKLFGHGGADGESHGPLGKEAGKKASEVAQQTILKDTAKVRAEFMLLVQRLKAQGNGEKAVQALLKHQVARAERRAKSYSSWRPNYGAAAETDMWRAFDTLKARLDDEAMLETMKWLGHMTPEEFDGVIEALIDNNLSQRLGQIGEVLRRIGDSIGASAEKVAIVLSFLNDTVASTPLSKKGVVAGDWVATGIATLKSARQGGKANFFGELGVALLEGIQMFRGAIRTGNIWLWMATILLVAGPVAATCARLLLPEPHNVNVAVTLSFAPVISVFLWIFKAGPMWLLTPEILSLGGSLTDGATRFARQARNKFLSWTGVSLVLGLLLSVLPSENSILWAFVGGGVMIGSALWNVSPPSVKFHWWAWLTAIAVVIMLLLGGPGQTADRIGEAWGVISEFSLAKKTPPPPPNQPARVEYRANPTGGPQRVFPVRPESDNKALSSLRERAARRRLQFQAPTPVWPVSNEVLSLRERAAHRRLRH